MNSTSTCSENFPIRSIASFKIFRFAAVCTEYSMCCQLQPPQRPNTLQRGSTRSSLGTSTFDESAFTKDAPVSRASMRIRSPGAHRRANTTRPSARRPTPSPPAASASIVISSLIGTGSGCGARVVLGPDLLLGRLLRWVTAWLVLAAARRVDFGARSP